MKNILISILACAALLLVSCQRDNLEPAAQGQTVTYTVQVPTAISTKALGDDISGVTLLKYEVYREADVDDMTKAPIYKGEEEIDASGTASFALEFVKDQDFRVLFWAQDPDADMYITEDLRNVTLKTNLTANNAEAAAFAGSDTVVKGVSTKEGNVGLVRPIAQLNIATSNESRTVGDVTVGIEESTVTVKGLSTTYNVATGETGADEADFVYGVADAPSDTFSATYTYVAMNYVGFAPAAGTTVDVDFTIGTTEGDIEHTVSNVPVKPNYRTNIIGNLITAESDYNITLNDDWADEVKEVVVVKVHNAAGLQSAIDNSKPGTETNVKLEGDIDLGALAGLVSTKADAPTYGLLIPAGKALVLDLNGYKLSQETQSPGYSMIQNNGTLTLIGEGLIVYKYTGNPDSSYGKGNSAISNFGILNVDGSTVENATGEMSHASFAIDNREGATLNVKSGTVKCLTAMAVRMGQFGASANEVNVTGGHIIGERAVQMHLPSASATTNPVMKLNVTGGTLETNENTYNIGVYVLSSGQSAENVNVKIGGDAEIKGSVLINAAATNTMSESSVEITGGFISGTYGVYSYSDDTEKAKSVINITGGTFAVDPSDYVANGYVAKQNENNLWTIVPAPAVVEGGYEISNAAQLKYFAESVNAGETTYNGTTIKLAADIDLQNDPWTPIGFNSNSVVGSEKYFTGTFDGQDHTIRNLKIDVKDQGGVGLFGTVYNASFKNFTLENVDIKAVESEDDPANTSGAENHSNYIVGGHIGAVVGYDAKAGEVNFENVHVKGLVRIEGETRAAQGQRIGGIIGGRSSSMMTFKNVSVKGTDGSYIKGYCSTAGVSGQIQNVVTYENVHTDIDVYAVTFGAGGIAGIVSQGSTFTNCSSAGDITLDASKTQLSSYSANYPYRVGGMAGCWSESATGVLTLTDCTYTGNLTSIDRDGNTPQTLDYAGYVGRGYTLNGCAGSKVVIGDVEYVQAYDTAADAGFYIVNGKYAIASAANLKVLARKVNSGEDFFTGQTVVLSNDINLNNDEWTPIGTETKNFEGNFDGNYKTIKNLQITEHANTTDGYAYAGLFGVTSGSEEKHNSIKDFVIENVNIQTTGNIAAAAVAYPYYTDIENITVKGNINIKGGDYTAGVLAYTRRCVNAKDLAIEGNTGSSITGNQTVGGVISDIQMNGGLEANYSNFKASGLTITGEQNVGGISGIISGQTLDGATVENVSLVSNDVRTGIIAGSLGSKSTIKNIKVTNVTGADKVVGATYDGGGEVTVNGDEYGE